MLDQCRPILVSSFLAAIILQFPNYSNGEGNSLAMGSQVTDSNNSSCRVYAASPYGFAPSTQTFMKEFKKAIEAAGCKVLDPWEKEPPKNATRKELMDVGKKNADLIDNASGLVAALDGPDVDSGTAAEIGYAAAKQGKTIWIVGYRGDVRHSGEKGQGKVNLQVQYFIEERGHGVIVDTLHDLTIKIRELRCKFRDVEPIPEDYLCESSAKTGLSTDQ
ncbi:MAG: nucleoside 2-deoxyribosyltransferase [Nitrospira sp.]|nr:nucleoside 2-deoxyribosyltransferase [Nitrospira sp.]